MRAGLRHPFARFGVRLGIALVVTGTVTGAAVETVQREAHQAFERADTTDEAVVEHLDPIADPTPDEQGEPDQPRTELPQTFLIVGTDSRAGLNNADGFGTEDDVGGSRADAIMLARVDPVNKTAYVLSIPRDTWVLLPTVEREGKINEALTPEVAGDGPDAGVIALIDTVKANFGVTIHHYMQVDFAGVQSIVDALGGVTVFFYYPSYDGLTGLDVEGGCQHLDGNMALAYARSRHLEEYVDGRWKPDNSNDFGRIRRQQDLIRRLVKTANANAGDSISKVVDTVNAVVESLTLDPSFEFDDALALVEALRDINPDTQQMRTLKVHDAVIRGEQVLVWNEQENAVYLDPLRIDPGSPEDVRVQVVDGTGGTIAAGGVSFALGELGFRVLSVQGGESTTEVTEIRYVAGNVIAEAKAEYLARWLDGPHVLAPVLFVDPSADVELVVGTQTPTVRDEPVRQLRPEDLPPSSRSTTTTAAAATTAVTTGVDASGDTPITVAEAPPAPPSTAPIPVAEQGGIAGDLDVPPVPC
jgi:LCP family protein required for cell wall assembly